MQGRLLRLIWFIKSWDSSDGREFHECWSYSHTHSIGVRLIVSITQASIEIVVQTHRCIISYVRQLFVIDKDQTCTNTVDVILVTWQAVND